MLVCRRFQRYLRGAMCDFLFGIIFHIHFLGRMMMRAGERLQWLFLRCNLHAYRNIPSQTFHFFLDHQRGNFFWASLEILPPTWVIPHLLVCSPSTTDFFSIQKNNAQIFVVSPPCQHVGGHPLLPRSMRRWFKGGHGFIAISSEGATSSCSDPQR